MTIILLLISLRITPLTTNYLHIVDSLLNSAEESIDVVMYAVSDSQLIKTLIAKSKEGVKVSVILDVSCWNPENSQRNYGFSTLLKRAGVRVYFDDPFRTTHDKLIVIDKKIVIVGSHNWTFSALHFNNEASVAIYSKKLARYFLKHINKIKKGGQP